MQLNNRRTKRHRRIDLPLVRLNEERHPNARIFQCTTVAGQMIVQARRVQTAFGGHFLALLRNDTGRMRAMPEGDVQHLLGRGHFEVQRQINFPGQAFDIGIGNMPAVFPQMCRDTVRTGFSRHTSRAHRVRVRPSTRIPDRRHMIDIHAKP